jgi:MoaA/NifB/PqqE/SkfB family radical SAM enzyme
MDLTAMLIHNPHSKRENPFRTIYDNADFASVLQNKHRLPDFPFLVDIELTNHCNLACIMCPRHAMKRDKGFMSDEIFRKIIDECAKYKTPIRFIRFGEPFLHPNIVEFCEYQ